MSYGVYWTHERREFITLVGGGAAAWSLAAQAQKAAIPTIGYLGTESANAAPDRVREFLQGLQESGYIEGRNVGIIVGPMVTTNDYRPWPLTWFSAKWH